MNQRVNRSKKGKGQDVSGATLSTGSHVVRHDRGKETDVRSLQKATSDASAEREKGLAKASPFFKKVRDAILPKSKDEEAKAVAKAKTSVDEKKSTKATGDIKDDGPQAPKVKKSGLDDGTISSPEEKQA